MKRLVFGISLLVVCYAVGGPTGLYAALLLLGLLGVIVGPPSRKVGSELAVYESQERLYERIEHARKGSNVDPTRPAYDDEHPLLLTNEFRRVK